MEEPSGGEDAASLAPGPRRQAHGEGRSPRQPEAFEDAMEEAWTASASPVACREGDGEADAEASPSSSTSVWRSQGDGPAGAGEAETYESPSASSSGRAAMEGGESTSVSELREEREPGRVGTVSAPSPSEPPARGAEEHESPMATPGAGSPLREETESSVHSAPSSPARSATSTSSSPLLQIKQQARHVRTSSFQRFRQQMQRAWKWGPIGGGERSPREQLLRTTMNIEAMTNQKRQWYQIHSMAQVQSSPFRSIVGTIVVHFCANFCLAGRLNTYFKTKGMN